MKSLISKFIFILFDMLTIFLSIYLAYQLRSYFLTYDYYAAQLSDYFYFYPIYITPLLLFFYEGIYTYRYDFWHESRLILKSLFFSSILVFAYLGMTKYTDSYSRLVLGFSFIFMTILIPLVKNVTKKILFKIGFWQKKAKIYGKDPFLTKEIYGNPYLGYIQPKQGEKPSTVFINSKDSDVNRLKEIIASQIKNSHEVIFIPLIDDYDMTQSHTYELSNTRTNLVVFKNRLKSYYRLQFKRVTDIVISLFSFIILIPVMLLIILKIKIDEPDQPVFYKQKRFGKNKKIFTCYKFRTMKKDAENILENYLTKHPEEIIHFEKYHKYKNDPRVTRIGKLLRNTSMDELPQILNVIKRDMSFIGPRPYMVEERNKIEKDIDMILSVSPGITGLWQVSGRSQTDFKTRIELDKWYIRNWSLWVDIVIFIKTIKVVLKKDGAS